MERLKFESGTLLTPEAYEKRISQVTKLLQDEGLRLDDLEAQGSFMLGGIDLGTYIGAFAAADRLQVQPRYHPDGTFDCDVIKFVEGKELIAKLKADIDERTDQARLVLARRKLIPRQFR